MSLSWNNVMSTKRSSRKKRSMGAPLFMGVLALGAMGAFGGFFDKSAGVEESKIPVATEVVEAIETTIAVELYGEEEALLGVELLKKGKITEGEKWFSNYMTSPDGRDDQALWAMAKIKLEAGETKEAAELLQKLVKMREDSLRSGDALYELGVIADKQEQREQAASYFKRALKYYSKSRGGRRAAMYMGDKLYTQFVENKMKRTEWERIGRLYSLALSSMSYDAPERDEVISKLDRLNSWVIFTPYARPKANATTNIIFHRVKRGESLGTIANHYGVPVGSIKSINRLPEDSHVIRIGDELKIVLGRASIEVNLEHYRLTVWLGGQFLREYKIGTGRNGRTPIGKFVIASRLIDPPWYSPDGIIYQPGHPKNILGTRWLGFEKKGAGKGIGIHGSKELSPGVFQGIGKAESNGCVRMRNPDVEELFDFVPRGTEVRIVE